MQEQKKYLMRNRAMAGKSAAAGLKYNGRAIVDEAVKGVFYAAAAYLLGGGKLFFTTFPLGLALIAAANRKIPFILLGLAASALPSVPYPTVYIGTYVIAVLLRVITRVFIDTADGDGSAAPEVMSWMKWVRERLFSESVSLRMTASSLCAFIIGLYTIIAGGYRYYDLFGAVFAIVVSPAAVWLLAGWFEGDGRDVTKRARFLLGASTIMAGLCYAARDINVMGISVAAFGALFVTLWICRGQGILAGAAAGLVCGVAFEPLYAPLFVLAAIAYGLLADVSATLASSSAFAAGMIWGLYIDGMGALTALLPGLLLSAATFCGAEKAGLFDPAATPAATATAAAYPRKYGEVYRVEADVSLRRLRANEERLRAVSESFASLAEVFYNLSDRLRRPGILDLRRVCDRSFEKMCDGCAKHDVCWGLEYGSSLDMIALICSSLHESGQADTDCVPEHIKRRCTRISSIIDDINKGCASLTKAVLQSEKMSIFALDYDAMSRILSDALDEQRADFDRSSDFEGKVTAALRGLGIEPEVLYVWGARRRYVCARGIDADRTMFEASAVKEKLEGVFECRLEDPLIEIASDGGAGTGRLSMTFTTKRKFTVERAALTSAAEDSEDGVCGDSTVMFETGRDYFYALISDGMGTGGGAAFSSGVSSLFLEKMLKAGNRTKTALRMLNGVLRARSGAREMEYSATVDLLEVDLLTGEASLIKSGAAPTFVRRRGDIFKLHSKTVPLGILTALDAQQTKLELSEGDVIVMVSDGVADAADKDGGHSDWLADLLSGEWDDDLDRMARKIIGRAQSSGSRDDLSVVITRIGKY